MRKILTPSLLLFFMTFVFSQQQKTDSTHIENLEEVLITATKTERKLVSLPLPAQIISEKEIKAVNAIKLSDILNEQTGLVTVPDFGGGEGVQMQGLDSQYTLILIDGVPLIGRSAGTLDLNRIAVNNIKQIEIVKGASSSLYGSEALGGVINVITRNPKKGLAGNANYKFGTNNTHDASAAVGYKKNKFSVNSTINWFSTSGYDLIKDDNLNTVDPFKNYTLTAKLSYDFSKNTSVFVSGRYFIEDKKIIATEELRGKNDTKEWNTHVKLNHKYNKKWSSYFEFYTTRYKAKERLNNNNGSFFSEGYFNQLLVRPEIRATYNPNKKNAFIGGLGWNHETLIRTDFSSKAKFNSPFVYVQYDANPTNKINVLVGARFDGHNQYKSQFSPKIAMRYNVNDKILVRASVGYGFKAPDFRQLYFDFTNATVGYTVLGYNQVTTRIPELQEEGQILKIVIPITEFKDELRPENSVSFNIGSTYKPISGLTFNVNIFRNNIKDLIDTRVIANKTNGQNIFSYYNVDKVYTQGLAFNAVWKINNYLKLSGGYQLLFAKDKEAEKAFKNGEVYARLTPSSPSFKLKKEDYFGLFNRSRNMINAKVFYEVKSWNLNTNLRAIYRSKYGLYDTNANGFLDNYDEFVAGYAIVNWAINKTIYKNYELGLGVDNIFDFTDSQNISNISGRLFYGRINIKF